MGSLKVQSDDIAEIFLKTQEFMVLFIKICLEENTKNLWKFIVEKYFWDVYDLSVTTFSTKNKKIKKYNFKKDHNRMYIRQTKHIID